VAESAKVPVRAWKGALDGFIAADHLGAAAAVTVPTTLVWGDQDAYVPRADQDHLLAALRTGHVEIYEGTGHAVHWEQPERFGADVVRVLHT